MSPVVGEISFWFVLDTFVRCLYTIFKYLHISCMCQSISWLTSLLKLDKCKDISSSKWDIFLKFFGDIPRIILDHLQVILSFLSVCQSISWLTLMLILEKYRDIPSSGWDNFLKSFGDIPWMFVHQFQLITNILYVCQSASWLTSLLKLG